MQTLTPAYGRDYNSGKAAKADYAAEKDFILQDIGSQWDGKPMNRQQMQGKEVILCFAANRKLTVTR